MKLGRFAVLGLLGTLGAALAQDRPFYVGAPVEIKNVPVDVTRAVRPTTNYGQSMVGTQKSALPSLSFSKFFAQNPLPTWPPKSNTKNVTMEMPKASNADLTRATSIFNAGKKSSSGGIFGN